ncbi:MAG: endonuclease/exonuclease/phosphatase family protein [Saprospiraceae bacterium]|nr:endonuclease/exonuclease/phosphatase family protein [Saprospiraceae bacterium]MBK9630647.1 endonuclease/exonuclease/phosphatase family protein [Saprospiraceae bacterium]
MINFLFALNIIWGLICLVLYLVAGVDPKNFWLFSISSLLIPVSFGINIFFIFIWLFIRWRYGVLSLIILILGYGPLSKFVAFNEVSEVPKCKTNGFKLMSFNVYGLKNTKDPNEQIHQTKKNQFLSFLRKSEPDIFCVQENNLYADRIINETGLFTYVHYIIKHGTAIYSKYPIMDQGLIDFGKMTNSCVWADIMVEGRRLRVYSIHLESNRISKDINQLKDDEKEDQEEKIGLLRSMIRKYRRTSVRRAKQADMIQAHAAQCEYPVIIAGDFNDTPYSYAYRRLVKDKEDSFLARGSGIGTTYVGLMPGLRIDFILADKKAIDFCRHHVLQTAFSDHNPVIADIYSK